MLKQSQATTDTILPDLKTTVDTSQLIANLPLHIMLKDQKIFSIDKEGITYGSGPDSHIEWKHVKDASLIGVSYNKEGSPVYGTSATSLAHAALLVAIDHQRNTHGMSAADFLFADDRIRIDEMNWPDDAPPMRMVAWLIDYLKLPEGSIGRQRALLMPYDDQ